MTKIYVDGDGCAVKDEVFRVAQRYGLKVVVVANKWMTIPISPLFEMHVVPGNFDAADDWIVQECVPGDIVVTTDILLADRAVKKKARVLGPKGHEFTEDNIGDAVANRELMQNLRHMGEKSGPAPMGKNDRSAFLSKLDQIIQNLKKQGFVQ
jgi:uncharacterized protein YaiI (UPF0178 family)